MILKHPHPSPTRFTIPVKSNWTNHFTQTGLHLSNLITGSGLGALLALAGAALDPLTSLAAISLGAILFIAWAFLTRLPAPAWLCLCSSTLNLILTLSVGLTLLARVCPPEGKEFAVIPAYFLLCMSRLQIVTLWPDLALQSLFVLLFILHLSYSSSDLEPGFLGFSGAFDNLNLSLASIALSISYDGISQWCRLSSQSFTHPSLQPCYLPLEVALWGLPRWGLLLTLALLGRGALPYLFLAPLPTYSDPHSPNYLGAFYALILLLSSTCIASQWLRCFQLTFNTSHHLSRLQHILNLLLVGAAWAFPIHTPPLALSLYSIGCILSLYSAALSMISSLWRGGVRD